MRSEEERKANESQSVTLDSKRALLGGKFDKLPNIYITFSYFFACFSYSVPSQNILSLVQLICVYGCCGGVQKAEFPCPVLIFDC